MDFAHRLDELINEGLADGCHRDDIIGELEIKALAMNEETEGEDEQGDRMVGDTGHLDD